MQGTSNKSSIIALGVVVITTCWALLRHWHEDLKMRKKVTPLSDPHKLS